MLVKIDANCLMQICNNYVSKQMRQMYVQSVVEIMENDWLNPFIPGEVDLVCISNGVTAPTKVPNSVVFKTTCFQIKTAKFFRVQDRLSFETFGSRPRSGIIETKTETGNYSDFKNKSISPSLINLFFIFPKNCISSKRGFLTFSKKTLLPVVALSTRLC